MRALLQLLERILAWWRSDAARTRRLATGARHEEMLHFRADMDGDEEAFRREARRRQDVVPHLNVGESGGVPYLLPVREILGHHWHTVAQPGAGKTRLIVALLAQIVNLMWMHNLPVSICLVDPKGETSLLLLRAIAEVLMRQTPRRREELLQNIICVRPFLGSSLTALPGLGRDPAVDLFAQARTTVELLEFVSGARVGIRQGPAGTFAFAAMIASGVNFVEAPFLMRSPTAMAALAERVDEPRLQAYFRSGAYRAESRQTINGLIARVESILGVTALRAMFAGENPIDFRESMAPGMITIVDLDGSPLGSGSVVDAVAATAMTRLSWAAFDQQVENRAEGVFFAVDELGRIAAPSVLEAVERLLTTGRWLGLSLWSAAQYASQVPELDRLLASNTRLRAFGRTAAKEIEGASAEWLPVTGHRLKPPAPGSSHLGATYMTEAEEARRLVRRINRLPPREFLIGDRAAPHAARIVRVNHFDPIEWGAVPRGLRERIERGRAGVSRESLIRRARELETRAADLLIETAPETRRRRTPRRANPLPDLAGRGDDDGGRGVP